MKMTAVLFFRLELAHSASAWAWVVTSIAVVGSSAIRRRGLQDSAMAIIARWRRPPESCHE